MSRRDKESSMWSVILRSSIIFIIFLINSFIGKEILKNAIKSLGIEEDSKTIFKYSYVIVFWLPILTGSLIFKFIKNIFKIGRASCRERV